MGPAEAYSAGESGRGSHHLLMLPWVAHETPIACDFFLCLCSLPKSPFIQIPLHFKASTVQGAF